MEGTPQKNESTDSLARLLQQEGFSVAVVSPDVTYEELEALLPSQKKSTTVSPCDETKSTD